VSYRQSTYDPLAVVRSRRPKRPFNWVQWIGVGMEAFAIVWLLVVTAGALGWFGLHRVEVQPATGFAVIGMLLINSRMEEGDPISEEQRRRNQKWLLWTSVILVGIAAILLAIVGVR